MHVKTHTVKKSNRVLNLFFFIILSSFAFLLFPHTPAHAVTTFFSDEFDVSSHTELSSRTPDTGTSWSQLIDNGVDIYVYSYNDHATVQSNTLNAGSLYQANGTYSSANYDVSMRITFAPGDSNYTRSLAARVQDANNMYLLKIGSGASGLEIYKRSAGTWTSLGSTSYTPTGDISGPLYNDAGDIVTLRVNGPAISALVNGTSVLSVADPFILTAGTAGMGLGYVNVSTDDAGTGVGIDNFTVTSLDITDPTISSLTPADDAGSVTTTANLVIEFDEAVDAESGNITIYKTSDDSVFETIVVTSSAVTGSGSSEITIDPASAFDEEIEYYVIVDADAFDDTSGNSFAGVTASTTWSFTTADETAPLLSTLSPSDDASNVAIDTDLVMTFDETVSPQGGDITIYKTSDDSVIETIAANPVTISGSGTTEITINPTDDFVNGTEYYVIVESTAFNDGSSNNYAGISASTTWSFTTISIPTVEEENNDGGSGSRAILFPTTIGGTPSYTLDIGEEKNISTLHEDGNTLFVFFKSKTIFTLPTPDNAGPFQHTMFVEDLDLVHNIVTFTFSSEPQTLQMGVGDTALLDLDNNGTQDLRVEFTNLTSNKVEVHLYPISQNIPRETLEKLNTIVQEPEEVALLTPPTQSQPSTSVYIFQRNMLRGTVGEDVRQLQKYLNAHGHPVAAYGPGSPGNETTYFGPLTQNALASFQRTHGLPAYGYFGPLTRAMIHT